MFPGGISQNEFYGTLELKNAPQRKFFGYRNIGNTVGNMFLLQTYNAHKDSKGAEDTPPPLPRVIRLQTIPLSFLEGTLINLRVYLEKRWVN